MLRRKEVLIVMKIGPFVVPKLMLWLSAGLALGGGFVVWTLALA